MATSGSTDFTVTRDDIVRDALLLVGAIADEDQPTARQLSDCSRMLNMMVKSWASVVSLWPRKEITHTLTPGTQSYTVGTGLNINTARPLRVLEARRRSTSGTEIPVDVVSMQEYREVPVKSTQGAPVLVAYDPQLANGVLYLWPTGDAINNTLVLIVQRPLEDFDATGDNPDFPQEWHLPLVYGLAVLIGPQYGGVRPDIKALADEYLASISRSDNEFSSFFVSPI